MTDCGRQPLARELRKISEECIECQLCVRECAFLQRHGTPKRIAEQYQPATAASQELAFACSLFRLCAAVCPVRLDPAAMFLEMRRETVDRRQGKLASHVALRNYERRGTSRLFSYYGLPVGCHTVLFPGCALAGSRPNRVIELFRHLQRQIPALGIVLDCCTKPSHDLGRSRYFDAMFNEMRGYLLAQGIKRVLVACPSCYEIFAAYGAGLAVESVYEVLLETGLPPVELLPAAATVTIQDSCVARDRAAIQAAVRQLLRTRQVEVVEMKHRGQKTFCCGEGGGVGFVAPELSRAWGERRRPEVGGRLLITYCAGCANYLSRIAATAHLLDLLLAPAATLAGRAKVAKSPFTYLHRLLLKRRLRRELGPAVSRERTFRADDP